MLFSEICNSLDCRVYYKAPQFEDVTVQNIMLVNSKVPGEKMISLAEDLDISLMSTSLSMFDSCVALHQLMNKND
ncbi:MAG: hypothetical protein CSA76_01995 [Spirochaetales bacterium]|nr:MAG: hypothetical protein CSA76_01995 [Spirochaetales bacterium]